MLVDQLERGLCPPGPRPRDGRARLIVIEQRGRRAVEVATATLDEIFAEWKAYLGTRNFTVCSRSWISSARSPTLRAVNPAAASRPPPFPFAPSGRSASGRKQLRLCLDIVRNID